MGLKSRKREKASGSCEEMGVMRMQSGVQEFSPGRREGTRS